MCAGTVVEPPAATSAAMVSVTSRSRSVALKPSFDLSALIRTLARMGMVLRRSTTRWTWPSDFSSAARSTVIFMLQPACSRGTPEGVGKVARMPGFRKGDDARQPHLPKEFAQGICPRDLPKGFDEHFDPGSRRQYQRRRPGLNANAKRVPMEPGEPAFHGMAAQQNSSWLGSALLLLQLALEQLD